MPEAKTVILSALAKGTFIEATFSDLRKKAESSYTKIQVRPVELKGEYRIQLTYCFGKKVTHDNLTVSDAAKLLSGLLESYFKQATVQTVSTAFHFLVNKRNEMKISEKRKATDRKPDLHHNHTKNYLLNEGIAHDFLVALNIMSPEGNVFKPKYAKFRQINKYLEILEDAVKNVQFDDVIRVVDFGCGKAYLTFAMYYYFVRIMKKPVEIVGLDLKADVIADLTRLKESLGYDELRFQQGDIKDFKWDKTPDIVVSLHACDTATDEAISKAVEWGSKVIMAVPCCQHEAFGQITQNNQQVVLKQGILKERFSAIATDAIRATLMEIVGYQTVVMEFIDLEHTPKNLMIRGIFNGSPKPEKIAEYRQFIDYWHLTPRLGELFQDRIAALQK